MSNHENCCCGPTGETGPCCTAIKCINLEYCGEGTTGDTGAFGCTGGETGDMCLNIDTGALFKYNGEDWDYCNPPASTYTYLDKTNCYVFEVTGPDADHIGNVVGATGSDGCTGLDGDLCLTKPSGAVFLNSQGEWNYFEPEANPFKFADNTTGTLYNVSGPTGEYLGGCYVGIVTNDYEGETGASDGDHLLEINDSMATLLVWDDGDNEWELVKPNGVYKFVDNSNGKIYDVTGNTICRPYTCPERECEDCLREIEQCCLKPGDIMFDEIKCDLYGTEDGCEWKLKCELKGDTGPTGPQGEDGATGLQGPTGDPGECFKCWDFNGVMGDDPDFSIYLSTETNVDQSPFTTITSPNTNPGTNPDYGVIGIPDNSCLFLTHTQSAFTKLLSKITCKDFPLDCIRQVEMCLYVFNDSETKVIGKIWNFNTASWEIIVNEVIPQTIGSSRPVKGSIPVDNPANYIDNSGVMYTYVYNVDSNQSPTGSPWIPSAVLCVDYNQLCVKCCRDGEQGLIGPTGPTGPKGDAGDPPTPTMEHLQQQLDILK